MTEHATRARRQTLLNRHRRVATTLILLSALASGCTKEGKPGATAGERTILEAPSPDGRRVATLVECRVGMDINVEVRETIHLGTEDKTLTIYLSKDQGVSTGKDRIIWSRDSRYFLVIGDQFSVDKDAIIAKNTYAFALYDTKLWRMRCNDPQDYLEHFSLSELKSLGFPEYELLSPASGASTNATHLTTDRTAHLRPYSQLSESNAGRHTPGHLPRTLHHPARMKDSSRSVEDLR